MSTDQPEEPQFNIAAGFGQLAGVWANFASVTQSPYEFTIDFCRVEFPTNQGVLVARVSMSPLMVMQLIESLGAVWQRYTDQAMPKEVHDNGGDDAAGGSETDSGPHA